MKISFCSINNISKLSKLISLPIKVVICGKYPVFEKTCNYVPPPYVTKKNEMIQIYQSQKC